MEGGEGGKGGEKERDPSVGGPRLYPPSHMGPGHPLLLLFNTLYPDFVGEKDLQRFLKTHSKRMDKAKEKESPEKQ